jgi:UDP:flavonoid glycosyltransferase YjiC (YdhE family)
MTSATPFSACLRAKPHMPMPVHRLECTQRMRTNHAQLIHLERLVGSLVGSHVVPRPADYPESVLISGYWTIPESTDYTPPEDLVQFLDGGDAPVYMGFGSMPMRDLPGVARSFSTILKRLGKRGILCIGWSDRKSITEDLGEHVLLIDGAPHEWLFPRCVMAIHHGGAGTVAATLRAGIPCVVFSVLMDQPFWQKRCVALGVAPQTRRTIIELNEQTLEEQISAALDSQVCATKVNH